MPERHEIAGSDVKNPGFAGRSDGAVSKYRPSAVPPPRALVRKGSLYPFIFSMTVWTVLGVWAYNIFYTKKEEDEDKSCLNDPDYLQKQGFGANTGKKLFQKRTAESKGLLHFEGDNCTLPENVHLQVSVNNEYGKKLRTADFNDYCSLLFKSGVGNLFTVTGRMNCALSLELQNQLILF